MWRRRNNMMNLCVAGALAACSAVCQAQAVSDKPAAADYHSDPKFIAAYAKATKKKHPADEAMDLLNTANEIADGRCVECLTQLFQLEVNQGHWKQAVHFSTTLRELAQTPAEKINAALRLGLALEEEAGEHPKEGQLEAADAAFRDALMLDGNNATALFMDGRVLSKMHQDDKASARFTAALKVLPPNDLYARRARRYIEDPELAREKVAPAFEITTMDGKEFRLDSMGGKVVLIDFWATWCGPCNKELPHLQRIAKDLNGEPFELISVSWDKDPMAWRVFVSQHGMTWNQYRDADKMLSKAFDVTEIPHYFTIDSDGILGTELIGSGHNVEAKLNKMIERAKSEAAQDQAATASN